VTDRWSHEPSPQSQDEDHHPRRQELSRHECLCRLQSGTVARVAITAGALPRIEVVRYYLIGETVFFDIGSSALARSIVGHVVAFQSGTVESDRQGDTWSVCAVGLVERPSELLDGETILEMRPELVSGWIDTLHDPCAAPARDTRTPRPAGGH
jgi:hypothetical protein